jgi:hypothetical protein
MLCVDSGIERLMQRVAVVRVAMEENKRDGWNVLFRMSGMFLAAHSQSPGGDESAAASTAV